MLRGRLIRRLARLIGQAAVVFFFATGLFAQQESSSANPPSQDANKHGDSQAQSDSPEGTAQEANSQLPGTPTFRQLGEATPLPAFRQTGEGTPLVRLPRYVHLGPVFVADAEAFQIFDQVQPPGGAPVQNNQVTLVRGLLVYDAHLRRSRLALQYQPRLTVFNGAVLPDYYNQRVQLNYFYTLNRKWTVSLHDQFSYLTTRSIFVDSYFGADAGTGFVQHNDFLEGPSKLFTNGTELRFDYTHSARTQVSIASTYNYAYFDLQGVSSPVKGSNNDTGRRFENTLEYSRVLNKKSSFGLHYQMEWAQFPGQLQDVLYQSFGGSYSRQLSPTWRAYVSSGASRPILIYTGSTAQWTFVGDVNVIRSAGRSMLALAYSRDYTFPGFISAAYHDRGDAQYSVKLNRRLQVGAGIGYFREFSSPRINHISGQYFTAQAAYQLAQGLSWVMTGVTRRQVGDGLQVSTGARHAIMFGLKWTPPGRYEK